MIGEDGNNCCYDCFCEGEPEVDAEYICAYCEDYLCFDHMKVWPQPKECKPIHYCTLCYQHQWKKVSA